MLARYTAFALVALLLTASPVMAALVTVPTGLNPGDQYRLAFVTSGTITATSSDIGTYNDFVKDAAEAVPALLGLGTTWKAIGSTSSVDARDNTSTVPGTDGAGIPIYTLNSVRVAETYTDLWDGSLDNPIAIAEDGSNKSGVVFTGSSGDGASSAGPATVGGPLGDGDVNPVFSFLPPSVTTGRAGPSFTPVGWIADPTSPLADDTPSSLYGISGVLTVPVPEPSSSFLCSGLMSLSAGMRRRRTRQG